MMRREETARNIFVSGVCKTRLEKLAIEDEILTAQARGYLIQMIIIKKQDQPALDEIKDRMNFNSSDLPKSEQTGCVPT